MEWGGQAGATEPCGCLSENGGMLPFAPIGICYISLLLPVVQNAFVTTNAGVAVIDTVAAKSVATLALSAGNAAVSPDGTRVYVTQTAADTVLVLDAGTQKTLATIAVGKGPAVAAVSPDGAAVYVTNQLDGTVSVIDGVANAVRGTVIVGARPFGIAASPDGSKVYVANSGGNTVSVIATATRRVTGTVTLPFPVAPWMVAFAVGGQKAYVTDNGYGHVYVIATTTDTVSGSFQPASYNQGVAFSPNGAQAYVTDASGAVTVVDAVADAVVRVVALGGSPAGVAFSTDGTKAYVANGALQSIQVVDTNSFAITSIALPGRPTGFGNFIQPGGEPLVTGVGNGFTFQDGESPGAFVVIAGTNLASAVLSAAGVGLPTELGATVVLLDGTPIPLYYVSPTQINAQIPVDAVVSLASIMVVNGTEVSNRREFPVKAAAPGIPAHVINGDGSVNSQGNAAAVGSLMTVYFTGIGPVTNAVGSGMAAPVSPLSNAQLEVTVAIGAKGIKPSFAGLSPGSIGLAQVNVQVPLLTEGNYPLVITVGGVESNSVMVSVQ
jgi:uncharacterized protein (TIGR03437 family)